jgi:hypothetical protein
VLASPPVSGVTVICHSSKEGQRLANILEGLDAEVYISDSYSELRSISRWAVSAKAERLALLPLGFPLCPTTLLKAMIVHHTLMSNGFTEATAVPPGIAPVIFETDLLVSLGQIALPQLPSNPRLAVKALEAAARAVAQPEPACPENTPFDAGERYGEKVADLPQGFYLREPMDCEVLRRASTCAEASGEAGPDFGVMRAVNKERYRLHREKGTDGADAVNRGKDLCAGAPRILYVSAPSAFSGAEESLCQMVQHIDTKRFAMFALIGMEGLFTERPRFAGVNVICPEREFGTATVENAMYVNRLLTALRPSVIHFNATGSISVLSAAAVMGIPIVLHVRNGYMEPYSEYLYEADTVISVSRFLEDQVLKLGLPKARSHVIYDEVDTRYFSGGVLDPQEARTRLGIAPAKKVRTPDIPPSNPWKLHVFEDMGADQNLSAFSDGKMLTGVGALAAVGFYAFSRGIEG